MIEERRNTWTDCPAMPPREQSGEQPNYGTDGRGASLSDTSFTRREPLLNVPSSTAGLTNASTTELPAGLAHGRRHRGALRP